MPRRLHRCDGPDCGYCLRLIGEAEDRRDFSDDFDIPDTWEP